MLCWKNAWTDETHVQINHREKATLTQSSAGGVGGEGPRNAAQVLANSAAASALVLLHLFVLWAGSNRYSLPITHETLIQRLPLGIIGHVDSFHILTPLIILSF